MSKGKKEMCACGRVVNSCIECLTILDSEALDRFHNEGGQVHRVPEGRAHGVPARTRSNAGRH